MAEQETFNLKVVGSIPTGPTNFNNMDAVLIDINPHKKGIIPPEEFLLISEGMHIPNIVYEGYIDEDIIESVREKQLTGITEEGVVAKAIGKKHNGMVKIKTYEWLDKLRSFCNNDEKLFNRLK